jgi:hypothetical protein
LLRRNLKVILPILLAVAATAAAADFYQKPGFSVSSGLEYQLITQEYYNAVIDTSSLDPIETWVLAKDKIDDLFLRTRFAYRLKDTCRLFDLLTDLEVSDERLLGMLESQFTLGDLDDYLKIYARYENKFPFENESERSDGFDYIQSYLRASKKITDEFSLDLRAGFETVAFDEPDPVHQEDTALIEFNAYNYDYSILSARLGGRLCIDELTQNFYWHGGYQRRLVPDSVEAEYHDYRLYGEYIAIGLTGYLSLESELQIKDYGQPDDTDDYVALAVRTRLSKTFDSEVEGLLGLAFENYWFKRHDYTNQDYRLFRSEFGVAQKIRNLSTGPLVRVEFRKESDFGFTPESYTQWELGGMAGFLGQDGLFFDVEATYGQRHYRQENSILSSYNFISLSVMANYVIWETLSIDLIFDGDFESHEISENDSNLYLLTIGLSANF